MSVAITKKLVLMQFEEAKDDDLFCEYCYEKLRKTKEGAWYCRNMMCLNEAQYNDKGEEVETE